MKRYISIIVIVFIVFISLFSIYNFFLRKAEVKTTQTNSTYWFLLHRKGNEEILYLGMPGDKEKSKIIKTFRVKTGTPGEKPTPLPQLVGRQFWLIVEMHEEKNNPETAPYFLTLDIPVTSDEPYGPEPYNECNGQCNWRLPGAFGLHGINGDLSRLSADNPGSSGCVRHSDIDITYLFNLLKSEKEKIRYYVEDI